MAQTLRLCAMSTVKCHDPDKDAIEECGKRWLSGRKLTQHMRNVHATTTFTCNRGGKGFKTHHLLNQHLKYHVDQKDRPVQCGKCDKGFIRRAHLNSHLASAHAEPTKCDICGTMVVYMDHHKKYKHSTGDQLTLAINLGEHMRMGHAD